jgi:asparagine synthase (glutamine-hydrolysing)
MCGFSFIYNPEKNELNLRDLINNSLKYIEHRGPDAVGNLFLPGVAMGHRRLSIIDVEGSPQPMSDPTGRYHLIYNGEIYNYKELKKNISHHWTFLTSGDTEVLLAGLIIEGANFCKKMEGMWTFILWDKLEKKLTMGRDRMGKKPLYYFCSKNQFIASSELPALLSIMPKPSEDLDSAADYLRYGFYLPGTTAYGEVKELLPAHISEWSEGSDLYSYPYWSLSTSPFEGTKKLSQEMLADAFENAVRSRMVADVEVGAFLSGGIDSSLIVAVMCQKLNICPKTFTIGFTDNSFDERHFSKIVSEQNNTRHFENVLQNPNPEMLRNLVVNHVGQPFADSSLLPTALVAKLAHQNGIKVVLSGDGADELFSGYQRYQAQALLRIYSRIPRGVRNSFQSLVKLFPEPISHHSRSLLKKTQLFCLAAERHEIESTYIAPQFFSTKEFNEIAPDLIGYGHGAIESLTCADEVSQAMLMDTLVYLPQDILTKVDRATMAYSIESRSPFLDTKLVELAFSLPRKWHRRGIKGKYMLRETFSGLLPDLIWARRKQGFGVPLGQWFRNKLGDELLDLLGSYHGALDKKYIIKMLGVHRSGNRDYGQQLWAIYVDLFWRQQILSQ